MLALCEAVCEVNLSKAVSERLSLVSENSGIGDAINPVNGKLKALEKVECGLTECAHNLENRGRWKNICMLRPPEWAEGEDLM